MLACDSASDEDGEQPQREGGSARAQPRREGDAAAPSIDDAGRSGPAARDGGSASLPGRCKQQPLPDGELQNMASGPSVFGQVIGGNLEPFPVQGAEVCGLPEVRICVLDTDLCTESDDAGQFVLGGLPAGADVALSFLKEGYRPALRFAQLGAVPIGLGATRIMEASAAQRLGRSAGFEPDDENGVVAGIPLAPGEAIGSIELPADVTVTLQPAAASPIYTRGEIEPGGLSSPEVDRELAATKRGGWAMFFGVPPGEYALRFERGDAICSQTLPGYGLGLDADGHVKLKVVAGFSTVSIAAFCP